MNNVSSDISFPQQVIQLMSLYEQKVADAPSNEVFTQWETDLNNIYTQWLSKTSHVDSVKLQKEVTVNSINAQCLN